jgi:hypothetical protein
MPANLTIQDLSGCRRDESVDQVLSEEFAFVVTKNVDGPAGSQGLHVPWRDGRVHRQRALKARRDGLVPEGMQISFRRMRADDKDELWVKLTKQPTWHAAALRPSRVHRDELEQSDVVRAQSESATFRVSGGPRERALLLFDALVTGARDEGMTVTSATAQLVHHARTASSSLPRERAQPQRQSGEHR